MTNRVNPPALSTLTDLSGRLAAVTGAASGIGFAIAWRLSEAGADLLLIDQDASALAEARALLPGAGRMTMAPVDITAAGALRDAVEIACPSPQRIDIWVNNAGIAPRKPILEISVSDWEAVMSVNLTAAMIGAQIAAQRMIETGGQGAIVNIVSATVHRVSANPAHYRASKAGLKALTENLAVDLGRHGIRVLAVAPGLTETPLVQSLRDQGLEEGLEEFVRRLPLRRIGLADEVARVVLFAVSDLAAFMTGCVLTSDGGESVK